MSDGMVLQELLRGRTASNLASETALFLLLEIAEAIGDDPITIDTAHVAVTPEGEITLLRKRPCTDPAAVLSLAQLAEQLLSPVPGGVRAMLLRAHAGEIDTLLAFRIELEALLVPLNRGAARRVLGRWVREVGKSGEGRSPSAIDTAPEPPPERSATDTQPDSVPPFPKPPPMGDLASLGVHRVGTELETIRSPGSATDTYPDGGALRTSDSLAPPSDDATEHGAPTTRRSNAVRWMALVLLLAVLALLYAWRRSQLPGESHRRGASTPASAPGR